MYRFLLSARWLGLAALTLALTAVMILAGRWQLDRYQDRSAANARIDAADTATPAPIRGALPAPGPAPGTSGPAAAASLRWSRVTMTGRYDPEHVILARGRTVDGKVAFEVLTPLLLDGGTAVLVDRGWVAAVPGDAAARPELPPLPDGVITATGRVARSESGSPRLQRTDGRIEVRRITLPALATELPYPIYGSYVLLDPDQPGGDRLTPLPSRRENALLNGGYAIQWWLFAAMTVAGFGWLARREAHGPTSDRKDRPLDRVAEADLS